MKGPFSVSSKKLTFFLFKKWCSTYCVFSYSYCISVLVAFNQYKCNKTTECVLYEKRPKSRACWYVHRLGNVFRTEHTSLHCFVQVM